MTKESILALGDIPCFLKEKLCSKDFKVYKVIERGEISKYSNNNFLFWAICKTNKGKKNFFIKQTWKYHKRSLLPGKKKVRVNPERVEAEVAFIKYLGQIWGKKYVPEVLYFDSKNHLFVMSDVGMGGKLLIEEFENNKVHPELGKLFGRLFGLLHRETFGGRKKFEAVGKRLDDMDRLLNSHFSFGIRKYVDNKIVDDFYKLTKKTKPCTIWSDPVYRNIFIKKDGPSFVDFDHALNYDPALDNGILLAQWAWMTLKRNKKLEKDSQKFISDYIKAYLKELKKNKKISPDYIEGILERTLKWMGLYLVSRTDGKSGSYFKDHPAWERRIRKLGLDLFSQKDNKVKKLIYG